MTLEGFVVLVLVCLGLYQMGGFLWQDYQRRKAKARWDARHKR